MNRRLIVQCCVSLFALPLLAQDASVTLFNSGRMLVRRTLPISIPTGTSTQSLALGAFEPGTLTAIDPGVSFTRISYDPSWSEDALLRRSIGKSFEYLRPRDGVTMRATLLSLDPERWALASEGRVIFGRPGQLLWLAGLVPSAPTADVTVESDRQRPTLNVLYQTTGAGWSTKYRIFVGSNTRVEGSAVLESGRLALNDAEVQLLAGNIGFDIATNAFEDRREMAAKSMAMDAVAPSQETVGEAHLYTIPGRVTFIPGTQTVMPLFTPVTAKAERRYTVRGALSWYGGVGQETEEQQLPVAVTWRLDRKMGTAFGDLPLPAGSVAVFDVDRAGRAQLIGQGAIGHTAPGELLTVSTGTAFDITAKRTQTEYATVRIASNRTSATMGYSFVLQNAKDSAVTVEVLEQRGGEWSVLTSSVPPQKRSATVSAFVVNIPAKGSVTLTYRLRVIW